LLFFKQLQSNPKFAAFSSEVKSALQRIKQYHEGKPEEEILDDEGIQLLANLLT
jgi:hypothetical protein